MKIGLGTMLEVYDAEATCSTMMIEWPEASEDPGHLNISWCWATRIFKDQCADNLA
jgi:hypothetical protein